MIDEARIGKLLEKLPQIEAELSQDGAFEDQKKYQALSQEHAYLTELKRLYDTIQKLQKELKENKELLKSESSEEMLELLKASIEEDTAALEETEKKLGSHLVPPDPNDSRTTILELRAGTGGDEAALFVGDCVRMYKFFADGKGWNVEVLSFSESDAGGYKEFIMAIAGPNVHRLLQYEGGTHRVQRIPATETQGRVHTSAVTVAIMMEPDENEQVDLDEKDLRIDTYRSSGAGGQHVNTTDSAVRITHIPTGAVAYCQDERSQHKNKAKALRLLQAKIVEAERERLAKERAESRSSQIGTGDRSERIRTYNFPQNRITDHRINLTKYNLDRAMEGDLDDIIDPLVAYFHEQKLTDATGP